MTATLTAPNSPAPNTARISPPERSLKQRMDALDRANEIRFARAQLKRDLKAGRRSLRDLLIEPPEYLETAKVYDLLVTLPAVGRVKASNVLNKVRMSHAKTIGGMSARQRAELSDWLAPERMFTHSFRNDMPVSRRYRG